MKTNIFLAILFSVSADAAWTPAECHNARIELDQNIVKNRELVGQGEELQQVIEAGRRVTQGFPAKYLELLKSEAGVKVSKFLATHRRERAGKYMTRYSAAQAAAIRAGSMSLDDDPEIKVNKEFRALVSELSPSPFHFVDSETGDEFQVEVVGSGVNTATRFGGSQWSERGDAYVVFHVKPLQRFTGVELGAAMSLVANEQLEIEIPESNWPLLFKSEPHQLPPGTSAWWITSEKVAVERASGLYGPSAEWHDSDIEIFRREIRSNCPLL